MSSKIKYKTSFQDNWLAKKEFRSWLCKIEGNLHCAKCRVCPKTISVSGQSVKAFGVTCKKCQISSKVQVKHHNQ